MKRTLKAFALFIAVIGGVTSPASAAVGQEKQITSGVFEGTLEDASGPNCDISMRPGRFDLAYTGRGARTGTLTIMGCIGRFGGSGRFEGLYDGVFVLTAFNGATLTGTASGGILGEQGLSFGGLTLNLSLTVQTGSKQFKSLTGSQFNLTSIDYRFPSTSFTAVLSRVA